MQPSRIHHVGLPVSDLDLSVAWYREALGLTHECTAGVPGGVAFMVAPSGERLELLAVDVPPSTWDGPIAALRAGVPHTAWTVAALDGAHARAVEAGGRSAAFELGAKLSADGDRAGLPLRAGAARAEAA